MGIGMGFIFIPLTTLTISGIGKEDMGNATSIYNLVRNLGGSFGVAITSTLLNRRTQFHQVRLVDKLTPFDMNYALQTATERQCPYLWRRWTRHRPAMEVSASYMSAYCARHPYSPSTMSSSCSRS